MLLCGLDVFQQAFLLAVELIHDPSTDDHFEMMMSSEKTNQTCSKSTLKTLQYYLLRFLDSTCIPIFMVRYFMFISSS